MQIKNKRGQSTVEYILLVTAVIAVMIVFATNQKGGMRGQLGSILNTATNDMNSEMGAFDGSHAFTTVSKGGNPSYNVSVGP